jgi:hypothetical protein
VGEAVLFKDTSEIQSKENKEQKAYKHGNDTIKKGDKN